MKSLFFLAVGLLFLGLISCTDDNGDKPVDGECRLVNRSFNIPNDPAREEAIFTYDNQDRLIEIETSNYDLDPLPYVKRTEIIYSGDVINEVNTFSTFMSNPEEQNFRYQFIYQNGDLDSIKVDGFNAYENHDSYLLINYNSGKLSQSRYYYYNAINTSYELSQTITYTWNGNNIVKSETVDASGDIFTTDFSYDTMNKSYGNLALACVEDMSLLSENNVISRTDISPFNTVTVNINYTYDAQGYPATSTRGENYPLYEYQYSCN